MDVKGQYNAQCTVGPQSMAAIIGILYNSLFCLQWRKLRLREESWPRLQNLTMEEPLSLSLMWASHLLLYFLTCKFFILKLFSVGAIKDPLYGWTSWEKWVRGPIIDSHSWWFVKLHYKDILQEVLLISRREQWLGPQGLESDLILNPTTFC